ncbi:MAG: hypothetical protein AAFX81_07125 [Pseudomonadota bacterium]
MASIVDGSLSGTTAPVGLGTPFGRRGLLLVACVVAAMAAAVVGDPSMMQADDPELAWLLRGMAVIKLMMTALALALVWWRFGRPTPPAFAVGYGLVLVLMCTATVLVWQLSFLAYVSPLFHGGLITLGLLALKDDRGPVAGALRR